MMNNNERHPAGRIEQLETAGFFNYNHGDYTKEKYEKTPMTMDEIVAGVKAMKEKREVAI